MKKKIGSIVLIMMLVITSLQLISIKEPNAVANSVVQDENYLDFNFLHSFISNLSYIIHDQTVYGPGEIKKGRYFGSSGNLRAAYMIYDNFTSSFGFSTNDVREVPLGYIDEKHNNYTQFVEVTSSALTINHPDFLLNTTVPSATIPQDNFYPIVAVRDPDWLGNYTMNTDFQNTRVFDEIDFQNSFQKWQMGIQPYNISYNSLNNVGSVIGNIIYVSPGQEIPPHDLSTVFLLNETADVQNQIDNATKASGIILMNNASTAQFNGASNYNIPIVRVNTQNNADLQNLTLVRQILDTNSPVIAFSNLYNNKITFVHNLSSPECCPYYDFAVLYNASNLPGAIEKCFAQYLLNRVRENHGWNVCKGIIIYDVSRPDCHGMPVQMINTIRFSADIIPMFALPGFSVNGTIGLFLRDHSGQVDNTISGHVNQIHHKETPNKPGVDAYNIEADLHIAHSPNHAIVILSSRYDGMWNECPGDSGAGNGILMGVAKYMQMLNQSGIKPKYNVTFLMTTNEENGDHGAQFYNDSHPNDNIIRWIGTEQLGFNSGDLFNVYKNPTDRSIVENITKSLGYHNQTHYGGIHKLTSNFSTYHPNHNKRNEYGIGCEDVVFYDRENCETILIHKDDGFINHHQSGLNLTKGDVLAPSNFNNWSDTNMFYNITWETAKYYLYNPNCRFNAINYQAVDHTGGTIPDSLKATFTVKSVLPNDRVLVNASLYDASTGTLVPNTYQELNFTVNRTGVERNVTLTMPTNVKEGDYYLKLEVYNSTARINRLANLDYSANDSNTSSTFHLNHYHTLGDIRIGTSNQNVHNSIRASKFTLTEDALVHNITAYVYGCLLSYPIYQCMIYRASDGHLIASTAQTPEYTLGWHTFSFYPKPVLSKNTQYLLSIWGNNDNSKVYYTTINYGNGYHNESYAFGSPPQIIGWGMSVALKQYSIFCRYTLNLPPEIINVSNSPDTVGFGYNVTINTNVTDDYNNITSVKVNITYPNHSYGNYSMAHIIGNHYRYIFSNTWFVGQYNYTIWAADNASNVNSSSGYHFHVSANATISIATLKDSYTGNQYVNITDPPNPPDNLTLTSRGLTWNTYYNASSGENILESYQGPVNYQEKNGSWMPINDSLCQLASNHPAYSYGYRIGNNRGLFGVYFKPDVSSDWPVAFTYNRSENPPTCVVRSKLVGVGYVDPQSNWTYHYLQSVQSSQGQTNGNAVTYPGVFTGTDVTWSYGNTELKEAITMSNATKTVLQNHPPSSYGLHDATSYLVFITKLDYQNLDIYNMSGLLTGNVTISDIGVDFKDALGMFKCGLPLGDAYELNNESARQKLTYRIIHYNGNTYLLSGLKLTDLNTMVFPVVIDPTLTVYSTSSDGYIYNSGTNYNTVRTASSGTVNGPGTYISIGQKTGGGSTYYIYRGFVFFNTSTLPSNAYLDSATLSLYKKDDYSTTDFDITIQNGQPTYPHDPMQSSDYNRNNYAGNGGSLNTAQFTNGYNDIRLTSLSWVTKGGTTKLCLRSSRDINGNAPTGNEYVNVYSHEYTGIGCQPKLTVVYRNQSKIKNTGSTNIKGYLLIQVQFYNSSQGKWLVDKDTINETSPRTINSGSQLALDTIFNGHVRASDLTHGAGTYRVYTAFRDPNGNILKTSSGVWLNAWWQFSKT